MNGHKILKCPFGVNTTIELKKQQIYPTIMAYSRYVSTKKCDGIVGCICDIFQNNYSK
jgi:hypothetical protein